MGRDHAAGLVVAGAVFVRAALARLEAATTADDASRRAAKLFAVTLAVAATAIAALLRG